jgi:hypothetical protein
MVHVFIFAAMFKNKTKICTQNQRFCSIFALINLPIAGTIPATDRENEKFTNSFAVKWALVGLQGLHWSLFLR